MADLKIKWTHLEQTLNNFYDFFAELCREYLQGNGSIATYELFDSFENGKVINIGDDYFSVQVNLPEYYIYIEQGTSPHYPPIKPLLDWVAVKQGVPKVEGFAYAVQNKIAKEGTEAKPFFEPAKIEAIEHFEEAISLAIEEDIDRYISECIDEKLNNLL